MIPGGFYIQSQMLISGLVFHKRSWNLFLVQYRKTLPHIKKRLNYCRYFMRIILGVFTGREGLFYCISLCLSSEFSYLCMHYVRFCSVSNFSLKRERLEAIIPLKSCHFTISQCVFFIKVVFRKSINNKTTK